MKECCQICINYCITSQHDKDKMVPYYCIFEYEKGKSLNQSVLKAMKCIQTDHTGFKEMDHKDMCLSRFQGIKTLYIPLLDYLIMCSKHDYQPIIYGSTKNDKKRIILENTQICVKSDDDRGNGNICDMMIDICNNVPVPDLEGDDNLPPLQFYFY